MAELPTHIQCDAHGLRPTTLVVHAAKGEYAQCDVCYEQHQAYLVMCEEYNLAYTQIELDCP